jgi:hypothetical protein
MINKNILATNNTTHYRDVTNQALPGRDGVLYHHFMEIYFFKFRFFVLCCVIEWCSYSLVSFSERCKTPCNEGEVCGCFVAFYHLILFFIYFTFFLLFITFLLLFYFIGLFCIVFKGFYVSSSLLFSPTLTDRHAPPQSDILGHLHPHTPPPPSSLATHV